VGVGGAVGRRRGGAIRMRRGREERWRVRREHAGRGEAWRRSGAIGGSEGREAGRGAAGGGGAVCGEGRRRRATGRLWRERAGAEWRT